jgi:hypothetical protein
LLISGALLSGLFSPVVFAVVALPTGACFHQVCWPFHLWVSFIPLPFCSSLCWAFLMNILFEKKSM